MKQISLFANVPPEVWRQRWVVDSRPVGDGQSALKYSAALHAQLEGKSIPCPKCGRPMLPIQRLTPRPRTPL